MLRKLCRDHSTLDDGDIAFLEKTAAQLPLFGELAGADMFLDCPCRNGECIVVAESLLPGGGSAYKESVVGKYVMQEKEPAVFMALKTALPARDILGVTQEEKTVWQAVVPVKNGDNAVIGVIVQEKDISESVSRERKYESLVRMSQNQRERLHRLKDGDSAFMPGLDENRLIRQELHHRVKNNMQLIASMLNLQGRNNPVPEIKKAFKENVGRILSLAAVYDVLSTEVSGREVALKPILAKICANISTSASSDSCAITVSLDGDNIAVSDEKAVYIALAVNELVMNAIKHAFAGRDRGSINVLALRGHNYSSIIIRDDGIGTRGKDSLDEGFGMTIVRTLVSEKLGGTLQIAPQQPGMTACFDFSTQ